MGLLLPIIALTADAMDTDERHCPQAGRDGCFRKPIAVDELLKLVSKLTGGVLRDELERYRQDGQAGGSLCQGEDVRRIGGGTTELPGP